MWVMATGQPCTARSVDFDDDDGRVLDKMENASVQWDALTDGGGLCTEQVGVGGELVVRRGVQYGMGWAVVQKGHLTLPDGNGGLVQGGGGGRRGWGKQTGWRRGREGATWRGHTHTHSGKSVLHYGVKLVLFDEITWITTIFFFSITK